MLASLMEGKFSNDAARTKIRADRSSRCGRRGDGSWNEMGGLNARTQRCRWDDVSSVSLISAMGLKLVWWVVLRLTRVHALTVACCCLSLSHGHALTGAARIDLTERVHCKAWVGEGVLTSDG